MAAKAAVRALEPELKAADIDTLLIDIHDAVGSALLDRFAFQATPTFIVFDASGVEVWRDHRVPSLEAVQALASPAGGQLLPTLFVGD